MHCWQSVPSHRLGSGRSTSVIGTRRRRRREGLEVLAAAGAVVATRAAGDDAVVQGTSPPALEIVSALRAPGLPHEIVRRGVSAAHQQRQHFVIGPASEQWPDQRLDETCRAVAGPQIGPGFEFVRLWYVPGRKRLRSRRRSVQDAGESRPSPNAPDKFEISRRVVARIYADHHELADVAGIEVARPDRPAYPPAGRRAFCRFRSDRRAPAIGH